MPKLPSPQATITIFLSFMATFIGPSLSARTLTNIPTYNLNHNHSHSHLHKITFLMRDILNTSPIQPSTTNDDFPFSKPLSISPPTPGITVPPQFSTDDQTQTLDLSSVGFLFPTKATLQELKLRKITLIQQELLREVDETLDKFGKAEGVYVGSSEDGSSYMMALTAKFEKEEGEDDVLRLFGVQRRDVLESHVAVIGGSGKYEDANGYAAVKVVERVGISEQEKGKVTSTTLLSFDVYLMK